ncbi:MAG: PAS domain S-box protein [Deltaproteobacteria bacterium]|nr:PAS domain S-box protein [Deltaproteobacteria bacterium]
MISAAPASLSEEEALRENERRFRALVEGSLTGISIVQDGQVVYQNPEMERLLGPLPRASKLADFTSIHPDDVAKVEAFHHQCMTGEANRSEIDFRFFSSNDTPPGDGFKRVNCRTSLIRYQGRGALLVNMMDITRMRQMEPLLRIQDKMASLGRVAAGIAHGTDTLSAEAQAAGVDGYLVKPVDMKAIESELRRLVSHRSGNRRPEKSKERGNADHTR